MLISRSKKPNKNLKLKNFLYLNFCFFKNQKQRAVASLVTVISLGTLIFIISLSTSIISYYSNQNIAAVSNSQKAYYAAFSGIQDALLKLQRNKDFSSSGYYLSLYSSNDVNVEVFNTSGQATINSQGGYSSINKKIQSIALINTTTGLVTTTSTLEQNL